MCVTRRFGLMIVLFQLINVGFACLTLNSYNGDQGQGRGRRMQPRKTGIDKAYIWGRTRREEDGRVPVQSGQILSEICGTGTDVGAI